MTTKLKSLLRLVARGDWSAVRTRWHIYTAQRKVCRAFGRPFVYHTFGFPFVCHPDWPDSADQFSNLAGDRWELDVIRTWLRQGDSAIDIGANLGFYTLGMSDKVGRQGSVVAVDADSYASDKIALAAAVIGHDQISSVRAAVADQNGHVDFYVRADHSVTGTQSMRPDSSEQALHTAVSTPCVTIEHLARELNDANRLAVIKIDVEGAEALAFRAAPRTLLSSDGPFWLVEIHPGALARFDATPKDITRRFSADDFSLFLMPKHPLGLASGDTSLRRLLDGERYEDSLYYNLLAIPRGERWSERRRSIAHFIPGLERQFT